MGRDAMHHATLRGVGHANSWYCSHAMRCDVLLARFGSHANLGDHVPIVVYEATWLTHVGILRPSILTDRSIPDTGGGIQSQWTGNHR